MNLSDLINYLQDIYDDYGNMLINIQGYNISLSPNELFEIRKNYYTKDYYLDIRGDNLQLEYNKIIKEI